MSALPVNATAAPLPPLPSKDPLSAEQWGILSAIADAATPSLTQSKGNRLLQQPLRREIFDGAVKRVRNLAELDDTNDALATAYLNEAGSAQPEFREHFSRLLAFYMSDASKKGLLFILNALNTRAGALLLTGHATPLDCLPIQDREQILLGWSRARLPFLRQLHRSLLTLVRVLWLRSSPTLPQLLAYPVVQVNASQQPGDAFPYRFIQIPPGPEPHVIETDVVIVGSGCGGAVAAKTLAEAGLKVLVVDKQYYWAPEYFPMDDNHAGNHMFGNGGAHMSDDASIAVVAGSTWGGGGTINWSASLQPQGIVRREWAYKFGLSQFMSMEFQADLEFVCDRMGVSSAPIKHNRGNLALLEGSRKLGWSAKAVPQNTGGEEHSDGFCTRGCRDCGKKGPTVTWLPDAAEAGAQFIEGFDVKEILFGDQDTTGDRETIGVKGLWTSRDKAGGVAGTGRTTRELIIKARKTIVSGGSLYTPILLQRSGLKNKHIGRHLRLHPVSMLAAVWDEDIRPWEGPILTSVVNEFENLDGDGYGAKIECTTMLPGTFLGMFPWTGGLAWKEFTLKMRRMTGYISLARDRYGGRVYSDTDGRCMIEYSPSAYDKAHILEGIARCAEIVYVEGAREIHAAIPGIEPFVRPHSDQGNNVFVHENKSPSPTDSAFQTWLEKLRKNGFPAPDSGFGSAHQMGSCRMGTSPKNSAVDHRGRVWGTKGLYIADTSVFPSASGVNPMITCMGVARMIARGIANEEKGPAGSTVKPSPKL